MAKEIKFVPLTERDRELHARVKAGKVERLEGAIQLGNPDADKWFAVTYGTHLKEGRVAGLALDYLLSTEDFLLPNVGLLVVCPFPLGVDLAFESDDRADWKQYRGYPGCQDGNRIPADCSGQHNYVLDRVAAINELFTARGVVNLCDFHSSDGPSTPGYLGCAGPHEDHAALIPYLSVGHFFTDVGKIQLEMGTRTKTFSAASGARIGSEIEVGQTGTEKARTECLKLLKQWGKAVGAFTGRPRKTEMKQVGYRMVESFMAPNGEFRVADERLLQYLAPVAKDEPVLFHPISNQTIRASQDQFLVWAPDAVTLAPEDLNSEIFFGCVKA